MEVDGAALRRNLARVRASVGPGTALIPMVKADAYGLGMLDAVKAMEPEGPWGFGVAAVSEGVTLRRAGYDGPVVVFSPCPPQDVEAAVEAGLTLTLSSLDGLERLRAAAARLPGGSPVPAFHVEIDSGMGRAGFDPDQVANWGRELHAATAAGLRWEGCFTHLHSADENAESVHAQWDRFQAALAALGPPDGTMLHALNSPGAFRTPEYAADAVRPGIFLYGGRVGADLTAPEPVASVKARVVHVRDAAPGTPLGYGSTYRAARPERWATLAIGYGDGFPRALSNRGSALVNGRRVPIIGRISMDVTVVLITDAGPVQPGDVATLIGSQGQEIITVDEVAGQVNTISYEILTGFTPRIPRVWT